MVVRARAQAAAQFRERSTSWYKMQRPFCRPSEVRERNTVRGLSRRSGERVRLAADALPALVASQT